MKSLTKKQNEVYEYLRQFIKDNGYPPTVREIGTALNLKSPSTVHFHLKSLEKAGLITRSSGKTRAITAVENMKVPNNLYFKNKLPVLGSIASGLPILDAKDTEEFIDFDVDGLAGEYFALHVDGDSMTEAGILPGDYVIVRKQSSACHGEIVVALIDDVATCKRFHRVNSEIWLLPENDKYEPIEGSRYPIMGVVIAVVRKYY